MPKVSVLMGVYFTGENTQDLENSVKSILSQTYTDFEFLIHDEGSNAAAEALLDQLAAADSRILLVRGDGARTLPEKLNRCLKKASGVYLARQDADDLSLENRLEKQVAFLDAHPEFAFVGSNVSLFFAGNVYGERCFPPEPTKEDFRFSMPFIHPALLLRKSAVQAVGGYSLSKWAVLCEDYDLLLRMYAQNNRGYNLQEKLFCYQVGPLDYQKRKYRHRINEAVTRFARFRQLGMLPGAFPYVVKPLVVGLLPYSWVNTWKQRRESK